MVVYSVGTAAIKLRQKLPNRDCTVLRVPQAFYPVPLSSHDPFTYLSYLFLSAHHVKKENESIQLRLCIFVIIRKGIE